MMHQANFIRSLEPILEKAVAEFPAVVLTGSRQSDKTTVRKRLPIRFIGTTACESISRRASVLSSIYPSPVIFDEGQHAPFASPKQ